MAMKVSLDGGNNWQDAPDVRVLYDDISVPGEDESGEVQITLTHEGLIRDLWVAGVNIGTGSQTIDELTVEMVENN